VEAESRWTDPGRGDERGCLLRNFSSRGRTVRFTCSRLSLGFDLSGRGNCCVHFCEEKDLRREDYQAKLNKIGKFLLATAALIALVLFLSPILAVFLDLFFSVFMKD